MLAGVIPIASENHVESIAAMGLGMQKELVKFNEQHNHSFQLRNGIHTGEAVAGVIGIKEVKGKGEMRVFLLQGRKLQ